MNIADNTRQYHKFNLWIPQTTVCKNMISICDFEQNFAQNKWFTLVRQADVITESFYELNLFKPNTELKKKKLFEIGFAGHSRNASNSPRSEAPENKF